MWQQRKLFFPSSLVLFSTFFFGKVLPATAQKSLSSSSSGEEARIMDEFCSGSHRSERSHCNYYSRPKGWWWKNCMYFIAVPCTQSSWRQLVVLESLMEGYRQWCSSIQAWQKYANLPIFQQRQWSSSCCTRGGGRATREKKVFVVATLREYPSNCLAKVPMNMEKYSMRNRQAKIL